MSDLGEEFAKICIQWLKKALAWLVYAFCSLPAAGPIMSDTRRGYRTSRWNLVTKITNAICETSQEIWKGLKDEVVSLSMRSASGGTEG